MVTETKFWRPRTSFTLEVVDLRKKMSESGVDLFSVKNLVFKNLPDFNISYGLNLTSHSGNKGITTKQVTTLNSQGKIITYR